MKRKRLTLKQRTFVNEYVKTKNGTKAALKAYDTKSESCAADIAYENLRKPEIQETIQKKFSKEDITVEWVLEKQKELASGSAVENHVRAKVLKDLGEFLSMYKDKGTSPVTIYGADATTDELAAEIEELRSREGKARPVLPSAPDPRIQSTERSATSKDL